MEIRKKDWQTYEQLAAKIYKSLDPEAKVKHNDHIYGHDTETMRQIDVSIRSRVGSHDILIVVQVRDRNRAPNINDVGEFAAVIQDVRASSGVLVCKKPPGPNAKRLAQKHRIDICTAVDVSRRDWSEDIQIPVVVDHVRGDITPHFTIIRTAKCPPVEILHGVTDFQISKDECKTKLPLLEFVCQEVNSEPLLEPGCQVIDWSQDELHIYVNDTHWFPLRELKVRIELERNKLFRYCKPSEYLALKNYSTDVLSVTSMRLSFPPLNNPKAWKTFDEVDLSKIEAQLVPIVSLSFSHMAQTGAFGITVFKDEEE